MRAYRWTLALALLGTPLHAQARPDPEGLRQQVVDRFLENYRTQAGLTDVQYAKLQAAVRRQWDTRRTLQSRERDLLRALEGQLRPGVAADRDSVSKLLTSLTQVRTERIEALQAEQREAQSYLDPVQQAQLVLAFDRLERQIQQLIQQRMQEQRPRRFQ